MLASELRERQTRGLRFEDQGPHALDFLGARLVTSGHLRKTEAAVPRFQMGSTECLHFKGLSLHVVFVLIPMLH